MTQIKTSRIRPRGYLTINTGLCFLPICSKVNTLYFEERELYAYILFVPNIMIAEDPVECVKLILTSVSYSKHVSILGL